MNLDETQQKKVAAWIDEGLKLSDIQKRLETEFGLRVTYLDVRLAGGRFEAQTQGPPPATQTSPAARRNRNPASPRRTFPPAKSASAWTN